MDFAHLEISGDAPPNPLELFREWYDAAKQTDPQDFNAMTVATADQKGRPSARVLLLKGYDDDGFVFYTNRESRKGIQLGENTYAALCFYWPALHRQVRIEGPVSQVSDEESDAYFSTRPKGSRIGAWASQQSRPLESRSAINRRIDELDAQYEGNDTVPRPPYWGGYRLKPERFEFWQAGEFRVHTRVIYLPDGDNWERVLLNP